MSKRMRALFCGVGRNANQQGFTLIEMSIVLAIIGLIVGGILKGQEVVNNARLKTQVAQIDAIKSAVFTFQDEYSYLPGDYPNATTTLGFTGAANGDGGGSIAKGTAATMLDTDSPSGTESVLAYAHLLAANLLSGISIPSGTLLTAATDASDIFYQGKIASSYVWLGTFSVTPPGGSAIIGTMVRLQGSQSFAATLTAVTSSYAMREPDAANMDAKYDDGSPISGSIVSSSISDATNCVVSKAYALGTTGTPTTNYCTLLFNIN